MATTKTKSKKSDDVDLDEIVERRIRYVKVTVEGMSALTWSRYHNTPRKAGAQQENDEQYEQRCWKEKFWYNPDGKILIPGRAFRGALVSYNQYAPKKIKGMGQATYTKRFLRGVMATGDAIVDATREDVIESPEFVPVQKGKSTRVLRIYPILDLMKEAGVHWVTEIEFLITDPVIGNDIFEQSFRDAGIFIGVGRYRPEVGGFYGRFQPMKFEWREQVL